MARVFAVRSGAILGVAGVLAAIWIGCGDADSDAPEGPTPSEATPAREAEVQAAREAREQSEVEAEVREEERRRKKEAAKAEPVPKPESSGGKFTGAQAKRYQEDREICGLFPPSQIAKEYGLPASAGPVSIAEAYADGYQPQFHQAAFEGCLDGLGS
jgi:hypothetical protein